MKVTQKLTQKKVDAILGRPTNGRKTLADGRGLALAVYPDSMGDARASYVLQARSRSGEAVRVGPGTMPAFGTAAFTDNDVNSIVAYVRYLDHPRDRGGNPMWHLGPLPEGGVAWVFGMGLVLLSLLWIGESAHSEPHGWRQP